LLRASSDLPEGLTHRAGTCRSRSRVFLPIWSCSVWGLPCPLHYCRGGALLPHLFTLTPALPPGRYIFCGTFRRMEFSSTLPDVIRHTALRSSDFPPSSLTDKSGHPAQLPTIHYMRRSKTLNRRAHRERRGTREKNKALSSRSAARDLTTVVTFYAARRSATPVCGIGANWLP